MNNEISIKGIIEITIIDTKTREILQKLEFTNALTNNGLKLHRNWSGSITPLQDANFNVDTRITHIAVGDSNVVVSPSQTALGNELMRKEVYPTPPLGCGIELIDNQTVAFKIQIEETELNGEVLREIGLFSESFTPFMVSRFLCGNLLKSSSVQFIIKYKFKYLG